MILWFRMAMQFGWLGTMEWVGVGWGRHISNRPRRYKRAVAVHGYSPFAFDHYTHSG